MRRVSLIGRIFHKERLSAMHRCFAGAPFSS
jgi:hypothetical protein